MVALDELTPADLGLGGERTVNLSIEGEPLTVTFWPSEFAPGKLRTLVKRDDPQELWRYFCQVVSGWNLRAGDDDRYTAHSGAQPNPPPAICRQ